MTYTSDNIVGVEFTVKGEPEKVLYKIKSVENNRVIITWNNGGCHNNGNTTQIVKFLNNGTWIVKNSKV